MAALLQPGVGQRILDLGCGTGDDARALARLVAPGGQVIGVDNSEVMLAEARGRTQRLDLPLEYRLGDAQQLDLPDDTFDGARTERTFMHLEAPERALAEMIRVSRPGGKVVVFDFDWDTLVVDHPDGPLTRKVLDLMTDSLRNGRIGRRLPGMFEAAGLREIGVAPHTVLMQWAFFQQLFGGTLRRAREQGRLSESEIVSLLEPLDAAARSEQFFAALTGFIVAGRKRYPSLSGRRRA
jgi:SAM-dependent methyltransferase